MTTTHCQLEYHGVPSTENLLSNADLSTYVGRLPG